MQPVSEWSKTSVTKNMEAPRASMSSNRVQTHVKGKPVWVRGVEIDSRTVIARGGWLKIAGVMDEDLAEGEIVANPESFVHQLKASGLNADIFSFPQKLPETTPKHPYHLEWENFAVIPITTYTDWWDKRVEPSVRRAVRKATKEGVAVKVVKFDDEFVHGIVKINNETPIRQGRPFWHYQKGFDAVKFENSTYADRNTFLGAYFGEELIGFARLTTNDRVANIIQILSMIKYYDKRPANALVAKAVEVCEQKGMSHLMYCNYVYNDPKSSLTEFKRRSGFEKVLVPRYYIPLTLKGKFALGLGFHRSLAQRLPKPLVSRLLKMRSQWYARRYKGSEGAL